MSPPEGFTRSSIEKLGNRLRRTADPRPIDLAQLEAYRRAHLEPLRDVVARIMLAGIHDACSARPKTTNSILRKLRHLRTNLSRMQDIAGCRIVKNMSRAEQDDMRRDVVRLFPGCRVDDRRARPNAGYRAVHVIVEEAGCYVEIQIRTELQHMWAQISERLADQFGPTLRYDDPAALGELGALSQELVEGLTAIRVGMLAVGDAIEEVEIARALLIRAEKEESLQQPRSFSDTPEEEEEVLRAIIGQDRTEMTMLVDARERELSRQLHSLLDLVERGIGG